MASKIQWTDETWNPIRAAHDGRVGWHCERISPGCMNCYAEKQNVVGARGGTKLPYNAKSTAILDRLHAPGAPQRGIYMDSKTLVQPLRWRKPRKVFVCSMSDLFGSWVSNAWLDSIFAVMAMTPHITYQVLTKRPATAMRYLTDPLTPKRIGGKMKPIRDMAMNKPDWWHPEWQKWPLPNVWLGTSVEDQNYADERIPWLLQSPAAVRFLSCEPLLGAVDLTWVEHFNALEPDWTPQTGAPHPLIDWVIVGGESGANARTLDVEWVRTIVKHCQHADVPVFVKQLGKRPFDPATGSMHLGDRLHGGNIDEWPEDLRVREMPL